jgi:VIT1/CCC1 family predicted Fe2+/Mn2+ transporter
MNETQQVLRKLADAESYKLSSNPSRTDRIVRRAERALTILFVGGLIAAVVLISIRPATNFAPGGLLTLVASYISVLAMAAGLSRPFAEPLVRLIRKRHRADDEFHHSAARAAHREPQVEALAIHDDGVLEDREDEIEAKLSGVSARLSVLIGDRSSVVTTGAVLIAGYKVATDLKWIPSGSGYSVYYIIIGAFIVLTPAVLTSLTERLVYRRGLLASARKRKARALVRADALKPQDLPTGLTTPAVTAAANDGVGDSIVMLTQPQHGAAIDSVLPKTGEG